jgi:hypothetical protein
MKKLLSILLSIITLISCVSAVSFSANAETKENKTLSYKYEYETKTLYVTGKGAIPANYLGWNYEKEDDYRSKRKDRDGQSYSIFTKPEEYDKGDSRLDMSNYSKDDYTENVLPCKGIYPDYYLDITRHVEKLVIGEGITEIGYSAFGCAFPNLVEVELPSTLTNIDSFAFDSEKIKSIVIPSGTKTVNLEAFANCSKLEAIVFSGSSTKITEKPFYSYGGYSATVYALKGSQAETYCKKNSVKYKTVTKPSKATGLKASTTKNTVKLTWSKTSGATQYQVQRYVASQKKWKTYATVTGTSYTFKNLKKSTSYKFRIRAVNNVYGAKFNGSYSNTLTAKTKK